MKDIGKITHELYKNLEDINDIFSCICTSIRQNTTPLEEDYTDLKSKTDLFKEYIIKLENQTGTQK